MNESCNSMSVWFLCCLRSPRTEKSWIKNSYAAPPTRPPISDGAVTVKFSERTALALSLNLVSSINGHGEGAGQARWTNPLFGTVIKTPTWHNQAPTPLSCLVPHAERWRVWGLRREHRVGRLQHLTHNAPAARTLRGTANPPLGTDTSTMRFLRGKLLRQPFIKTQLLPRRPFGCGNTKQLRSPSRPRNR